MQALDQELEDALERQNDAAADILEVCNVSFFQIYDCGATKVLDR